MTRFEVHVWGIIYFKLHATWTSVQSDGVAGYGENYIYTPAGAMSPKIFGDRNFAFGYVPEVRDRRGLDMSRKVIVPKTM